MTQVIPSTNNPYRPCIAPECHNGMVFGEICRACRGTGFILVKQTDSGRTGQ